LIFRRSFCGLICPFGALQEFFGLIGRKIFKKKFILPKKVDKPLRYLKYIILVFTVYFAWVTSGLWVDKYDPWAAYGHISEGLSSLTGEYLIGFILLIVTIIGSVLYDRFFCKYLCPMGALYAIISKLSPSKIVRRKDKCINCELCSKNCPVNIDVANSEKITSAECINCQSCMLSCPRDGALEFKAAKKTVKPLTVIVLVMVIFWGGILIGKATGIMETTPKAITADTKINVDEIKGYMTLKDVSTSTGINLEDLYKKLSIPDSVSADTMLKEVKNYVPDFEVETAKEILEKN
jgi:NAD-dependent dihydropyrimidine dehydrogenase PreA subunit